MKKPFTLQLSEPVRDDFEKVAEAAGLDDTKYAAVWIQELAKVKPEFALKVLGLIPLDWKKRRPGRPPSTASTPDRTSAEVPAQNVA